MRTSGSEIDLNLSFAFKILRIELNLEILLLALGFYEKRVTKIVVMQVKRRSIVSVFTRRNSLPIRDSCILNQNLYIRTRLPVFPAHKTFNREPVVRFMCRIESGRLNQEGTNTDYCGRHFPTGAG